MEKELLKVSGVEAGYGPKQILYGIDLAAQDGEMVAVIGHNGAGKSTLLKALFGLIPVWKGKVFYEGLEIGDWAPSKKVLKGIGFVPQGDRVFADLTVRENLEMGGIDSIASPRSVKG